MARQRPVIHARDHEHGGADPVHIAWEAVGGPTVGGGTIIKRQIIGQASTNVPAGGPSATNLQWGSSSGDSLVTYNPLSSAPNAQFVEDGFYIVEASFWVASLADGKTVTTYIDFANAGTQYAQGVGQTGVASIHFGRTAAGQGSATNVLSITAFNNDTVTRTVTLDSLRIYQVATAAAGGGPRVESCLLIASSAWDKQIPNNSRYPIHWEIEDRESGFDDVFERLDANGDPISPASPNSAEFVFLGLKLWGAVHASGWVSRPTTIPTDYSSSVQAAINSGLEFCTHEEWDHRVKNLGFSGVGLPFSSWDPPNNLGVYFTQVSGSPMTLNSGGSYAWCDVVFMELPR